MTRRRLFLVATVGGVIAVATAGAVALGLRKPAAARPPSSEALAFLGPLAKGAPLERWKIAEVSSANDGALTITLADTSGKTFAIDLLRRDDAGPAPVANTPALGLYLRNQPEKGASGQIRGADSEVAGALALARALAEREAAGVKPPALTSQRERGPR